MIYCALSLPESWDGGQRGLSDLIIKFAARGLMSVWKEATAEKALENVLMITEMRCIC